jgi:hypothetical protein
MQNFQYSTDPDGLYQGDSFTLNGNGVEIQIVKLVSETTEFGRSRESIGTPPVS